MKIAVIGSNGQLGTDLSQIIPRNQFIGLTHKDIEICDIDSARSVLTPLRPDYIINTAAYHRVDDCEDNPTQAFAVNAFAVKNLAEVANEISAKLVHFTSDYVFDGLKASQYTEEDLPNPISVYGASKFAGEIFLRGYCKNWILIRTTGLFGVAGSSGKGGNFIETMLRMARENKRIRVVSDQVMSPTFTKDLAEKVYELIKRDLWGIFHLTNGGYCSWYEFAGEAFRLTNLKPDFGPTTTAEFNAKARRPRFSSLANNRLATAGISPARPWNEALKEYLTLKGHVK